MRLSIGILVVAVFAALLSCTVDARPTNDDLDLEVLRDIITLLSKRDSLFENEPRRGPEGDGDKDQKGGDGEGDRPMGENKQEGEVNSPPAENIEQNVDQPTENQVNDVEDKVENNAETAGNVQGDLQNQDGEQGVVSEPNEDTQKESQGGEIAGVEQDTQEEGPGPGVEVVAEGNNKVEENDKPPKLEEEEMLQVQEDQQEEPAEAPATNQAAAQSSQSDSKAESKNKDSKEALDSSENLESLERARQDHIKGLEKMMGEALKESDVGEAKQLLDEIITHLETSESYNKQEQVRLEAVSEKLRMAENNIESAAALTSQDSSMDENSEQETVENTGENNKDEVGKPVDLVNEPAEGQNEEGNLPGEEINPNNNEKEKDQKEDKNPNKENQEETTGMTEGDQVTTSEGEENGITPPEDDLFSQNLKERRKLLKKLELIQTLRKLRNDLKA